MAVTLRLSKSKLAAFQHCPKRLWLQVHRRDVAVIDRWTRLLFEAGHRVGELARLQVANGILIDPDPRNVDAAIAETQHLLQAGFPRPLFEAAFIHEDVVVRVDILEAQPDRKWRLVEVKNSSAVRPYQLNDVASQAWVLAGCGVALAGVSIRLPAQVLRPGSGRSRPTAFNDVNVTAAADRLLGAVQTSVEGARRTIRGNEPVRETGPHCRHPFRCEFHAYCSKG